MKNTSDFVMVRLTTEGRELAGAGQTMRFVNAHSDYTFVGETPQKVMRRGEMPLLLAYHFADGMPVFELVAQALVAAAAEPTSTPSLTSPEVNLDVD